MRAAILSDIHSNWPALRAVAKDIATMGVDVIYCLGDVTGYGPFPRECIAWAREHCNLTLMGNHDFGVGHGCNMANHNYPALLAMAQNAKMLKADDLAFLRGLEMAMDIPNLGISMVHANWTDPDGWEYIRNEHIARQQLTAVATPVLFFGHTHQPAIYHIKHGLVKLGMSHSPLEVRFPSKFAINVGSVGQPRDDDPRACYMVVDFFRHKLLAEYRRVSYRIDETVAEMKKLNLDGILTKRLYEGS